jgi:hypothetical protein
MSGNRRDRARRPEHHDLRQLLVMGDAIGIPRPALLPRWTNPTTPARPAERSWRSPANWESRRAVSRTRAIRAGDFGHRTQESASWRWSSLAIARSRGPPHGPVFVGGGVL